MTRVLDQACGIDTLRKGGRVLWLAHGVKGARTAPSGFESVYWSAGWWGNAFSSLGIVCDPKHPSLREFPNDGRSDWQWFDLCAGATTFLLDGAAPRFRPVVQPVPDFHFNTRLAHVFEAKVERRVAARVRLRPVKQPRSPSRRPPVSPQPVPLRQQPGLPTVAGSTRGVA